MTRLDERGLPALGALFLGALTIALWYGLSMALGGIDAWLRGAVLEDGLLRVQTSLGLSTLIQCTAMGVTLFVGLRFFQPELPAPEALGLSPVPLRLLAVCVLAGLGLQFPLTELANLLHEHVFGPDSLEHQLLIQRMLDARSPIQGFIVVGCLVALVPLSEELLFRGLFCYGLSRRYGRAMGVLASSILFGLAHVAAVNIVYATVAGIILGTVATRTRSVWPGIALHGGVNGLPLLLPEHVIPIHGFNVPSEATEHLAPWLLGPALLLAALALTFVYFFTRETVDD